MNDLSPAGRGSGLHLVGGLIAPEAVIPVVSGYVLVLQLGCYREGRGVVVLLYIWLCLMTLNGPLV
jgi:hypothetical protein